LGPLTAIINATPARDTPQEYYSLAEAVLRILEAE
jgi:hypothetical protein